MNPSPDDMTLHRFLDGELDAAAAGAFRARLAAEPALRERLAVEQRVRSGFTGARAEATAAPAGFTAGVMAAVRRLPDRGTLEQQVAQQDLADRIVRLCRRLLIAAAVVFGLGLLWHSGLFDDHADRLEAAPDELRLELERLDARIRAGELDAADAGGAARSVEERR
jgi:anti-sigma factor RsiW